MRFGILLGAVVSLTLCGCISVATPAIGYIYTDVSGPIHSNGKVGPKEGRACAQSILGLFAQGDASIAAAAEAGRIKKVDTVDTYSRNLLGVIGDFCTVVHGS